MRNLEVAWDYHSAPREAFNDLLSIVADTKRKVENDQPATGGNTLTREIPRIVETLSKAWGWDLVLTRKERAEVKRQERVSRSQDAWSNSKVQKIARSYDILDRFRGELKAAGIVGVDQQLKVLFVAGHSRFLDRPISVAVKGPSSSGKSKAIESAVMGVQPDDAYIFLSGSSEKSLIYSEDDYRHEMLVIAEQSGVDSEYQDYLQRTLLSEGVIKYRVTEKIGGRFVVTEKVKEGPTGLITSTTRAKLHPENETRILSIHTTDTREHTKAIMRAQADDNRREMDTEPWKEFGTWLARRDNRVSVPYSEALADLIQVYDVRQSRDFPLLLSTIKTLAIMHQARRERDHHGRIVASLHDYEMARDLLNDLLSQGIGATVSDTIKKTVAAVKALTNDGETTTNSSAVAKHLGLGKGSVSDRVRNALAEGYVVNLQEPGKRGYMLAPGADLPEETLLLPEPHEVLNVTACNIVRLFGSTWGYVRLRNIYPKLFGRLFGLTPELPWWFRSSKNLTITRN